VPIILVFYHVKPTESLVDVGHRWSVFSSLRTFVLDTIVIDLFSTGVCPLEEASEHCSQ
jgi:hypothetical protein